MPPVKTTKDDDPKKENDADLFTATQEALATVKEKEALRDKAAASLQTAQNTYQEAVNTLNTYRAKLNEILGTAANDPRIRMSA